jgi:hypothetical protein
LEDPQAQQQANYTRVNKAKTIKATMTGKYLGIIAIPIIFLCSLFFAAVVLGGLACLTVFKIVSNRWRLR